MAERIGKGRCPLCGSPEGLASVSVKGWACLTCNGCKAQVFARGVRSDELLRAYFSGADALRAELRADPPAPAPAPAAPVPPPAPAAPARAPINPFLLG